MIALKTTNVSSAEFSIFANYHAASVVIIKTLWAKVKLKWLNDNIYICSNGFVEVMKIITNTGLVYSDDQIFTKKKNQWKAM